jgi:thiosulfate/3-mercaptopyruvate sulfurtransferase
MAQSDFLIEAAELQLSHGSADLLIIDARKPAAYALGHIPGAVNFSTYDIFATQTDAAGMSAFSTDMAQRYGAAGVGGKQPVVVYEDDTGMRAARDLWILEFLGHPDVKMLHGGLAAWRAAGGAVEPVTVEARAQPLRATARNEISIGYDEIARRLGVGDLAIIDVRDANEHTGRDHTACCARRGHIPGSVWIEWTEFLEQGRFKSPAAIKQSLVERGVNPEAELVPYCHRGARSANAYYALLYAGMPRVRNYIGSWHEWSARADLPLEIG